MPVVNTCTTVPVVRLDFRSRFAHFDTSDSFDFLPQGVGGVGEQLTVKLLHLGGPGRGLGQGLLGRRQGCHAG